MAVVRELKWSEHMAGRIEHYKKMQRKFNLSNEGSSRLNTIVGALEKLEALSEDDLKDAKNIVDILRPVAVSLSCTQNDQNVHAGFYESENKLIRSFNKDVNLLKMLKGLELDDCYAKYAQQSFEREYQHLKNVFEKYPDKFQWYELRGLIELIRMFFLRRRIKWLMGKIPGDDQDAQQTRIKVMRSAIRGYVDRHEVQDRSLSAHLIEDYYRFKKTDLYDKSERESSYLGAKLSFDLGEKCMSKQIALEGKSVKVASKISDMPLKRTEDKDLYSQFKLSAVLGRPADRNYEPLPDGWYSFVILANNEFRYLPTNKHEERKKDEKIDCGYASFGKFRSHSQLAGGQNSRSAGNFKIKGGQIVKLNGGSGHYSTRHANYINYAFDVLNVMGIDTSECETPPADAKGLTPDQKFSRFMRKLNSMWRGLYLSGEEAEGRPSVDKEAHSRFKSRIPTY